MDGDLSSVVIDQGSVAPPYNQIRTQIAGLVSIGQLTPGEKLPTVRALATTLGVASNTVARAYRELEHRGVVITRGRLGTVIAGASIEQSAKQAAADFVETMRGLNLSEEAILEYVRGGLTPPKSS